MIYTQNRGDFSVTGKTWQTDSIVSDANCSLPPYSEIRVISKNKIFVMINGALERKFRSGFELAVSGVGNIFPEQDQCLAVMAKSKNVIRSLPVSCIVNENGLKIEHEEMETNWYRIEGYLQTIDYPIFHQQ